MEEERKNFVFDLILMIILDAFTLIAFFTPYMKEAVFLSIFAVIFTVKFIICILMGSYKSD